MHLKAHSAVDVHGIGWMYKLKKYLYYSNNRQPYSCSSHNNDCGLHSNTFCVNFVHAGAQFSHSLSWHMSMGKPIDSVIHDGSQSCSWCGY